MTAADEITSDGHGHPPDANRWMAEVRAELDGATVSGCEIGELEKILERRLKELGRPLLEEAVQKLADRQPLKCPRCEGPLHVERHRRGRTIVSVLGKVPFEHSYGFCPRCGQRFYPAGQAEANIGRLTGLDIGQATMHREARRQGERALGLRDADVALSETAAGIGQPSA